MSSIQAAGSTPDFYYCLTDDFIDKKVIALIKESVLSKTHFENIIEETKRAYREEDQKTRKDNSRLEKRVIEVDEKLIKNYIDRFEKLLNKSNIELMREFLRTFIAKIELWGREKGKIRGRKVHIHGQIPAFTMIGMASPRGVEPLLQE